MTISLILKGDKGWDIFSLDYLTSQPINTILNHRVMLKYLRVSNLLWKLKRIEYNLEKSWSLQQETKKNIKI